MNNTQPQNPTQQPIVPNKPTEQLKPQSSSKTPLIITAIIALISLSFSAYLVFENTQLKKQEFLQQTSSGGSITPTTTPAPTSTTNITKEISSLESSQKDDGTKPVADVCYENNNYYLIFLKNYPTKYSRSLIVKNKTKNVSNYECKYNYNDLTNILIAEAPNINYINLFDNILLVDAGTSPDVRGIQIYDLSEKPKIHAALYTGTEDVNEKYIEYWKPTDIVATPEKCPSTEAQLFEYHMVGVDQKVKFEYETQEETLLEEYRCSGRQ